MNRIILNETHIRKLVKETLENLILGEDDNIENNLTTEEIVEIIKISQFDKIDNLEVSGHYGNIGLIFSNETYGKFLLDISFEIDGYVTEYDRGDYFTPPSGGELEIDLKPTETIIYFEDEEVKLDLEKSYDFIYKVMLNDFYNEIYEKIDIDDFIDEGPDPDYYYDSRRDDY